MEQSKRWTHKQTVSLALLTISSHDETIATIVLKPRSQRLPAIGPEKVNDQRTRRATLWNTSGERHEMFADEHFHAR